MLSLTSLRMSLSFHRNFKFTVYDRFSAGYHSPAFADHCVEPESLPVKQAKISVKAHFDPALRRKLQDSRRIGCDCPDHGFQRKLLFKNAVLDLLKYAVRLSYSQTDELLFLVEQRQTALSVGGYRKAVQR